jgi:peptidyl-prolyl cis-trans isomerase A (cyclophilin A)
MKLLRCFAVLFVFSTVFATAQQSTPPPTPPAQTPPAELPDSPVSQVPPVIEPTGPTVVLDTTMGRITCRFFDKEAPLTVANFIGLAQGTKPWTDPTTHKKMKAKPFYDGTTFHRVIPEFMIQGGDPTGTGTGDPGYMFADEFDPNLNFDVPGRMAMANNGPGRMVPSFSLLRCRPRTLIRSTPSSGNVTSRVCRLSPRLRACSAMRMTSRFSRSF